MSVLCTYVCIDVWGRGTKYLAFNISLTRTLQIVWIGLSVTASNYSWRGITLLQLGLRIGVEAS